jgi:Fe-S oxidoreductase
MVTEKERELSLPTDDWNRKYYWDMRKVAWNCARCSTCKWVDLWEVKDARFAKICPSSLYYLFDAYSCQGRMDLSLALIDEDLTYDDDPEILDIMYKCNSCGGCDAMCKGVQDMEPLRVMLEIRAKCVEDGQLLPQFMPIIDNLRKEDNMMMQPKADRGKWAEGLDVKDLTTEEGEVVFHAGCRPCFDEELWQVARGAVMLLKNAGVDVGIMGKDETCCGGRAYQMGYRGEFTKYAENNIEAWKNARVKTVVTTCADGYYAMKRLYPDLGSNFEVLHITEYIDRLIKEGKVNFTKNVPMKVTYHDPCHLGRRLAQAPGYYVPGEPIMGVYEPPRDVIRSIPGVELAEMYRIKEYSWCCGAGGGVIDAYPEFNNFTATERIKEAKETGAEAIVTACSWCQRSLTDAVMSMGDKMKVIDIVELVEQAI